MKAKVILAAVSINYNYVLTRHYYKLPSLGIGYIAAVLRRNNYDVQIIDRVITMENLPRLRDEIVSQNPDVVGFYSISETFKTIVQVLKLIKEKSSKIITMVGGPHVYGLPDKIMDYNCIDYAIRGEAEKSFLELLESNFNPAEFENIPGLIYRDGRTHKVNALALVEDLDSLPLPARDLYPDINNYHPSILAYKRLPASGIISSRGCAYRCIFCHSGKGHFKLRFHSAEYVLDEIRHLKHEFGVKELIFFDDTFLINRQRAMQICEGIINEKLDVTWSCNARVNNLNKNMLKTLKRAGCWLVQIGVESGNQDILKTIKKDISLRQVADACRLAYNAGLEVKAYFILGHPKETPQTLDDTIKFMAKLPAHYASINFMTPLPGTELWDSAEKYGSMNKDNLEAINYLSDRPAFIPFGLTEGFLTNKLKEAYLKFYLNPKTILRHIRTLRRKEDFKKISMGASVLFRLIHAKLLKKGKNTDVKQLL